MGPGVLSEILRNLPQMSDPNLMVGFDTSDDACVYKLREDLAMIQTLDFFPPVVDDPYQYGQIAAANALSDIYAMGATPSVALNILCIPACLPTSAVQGIMAGGYDKVHEAGAVIAGGHSVEDDEPKYGLCVTAFIHPDKIWSNATANPGDLLVLTKPLGTGILLTASKVDLTTEEIMHPALQGMSTLNKYARDAAVPVGISACTDITGFGFIGHSVEMANASGCTFEINASDVPLYPGAMELAEEGIIPGGAYRNREYAGRSVNFAADVPLMLQDVLFDPQTSGGLLFAVSETNLSALMNSLKTAASDSAVIGRVLEKGNASIFVR